MNIFYILAAYCSFFSVIIKTGVEQVSLDNLYISVMTDFGNLPV